MLKTLDGHGLGWRRDLPDFRDYTLKKDVVKDTLEGSGALKATDTLLPPAVDLRKTNFFSPIENQGELGSCTANAAAGLVEYYQTKAYGKYINVSRLFIYKASRNLIHETGDTGAYLRETMKALVLFGAPPEEYWPYTDKHPDFDEEPLAFYYAFGQSYNAIKYYRLDPPATPKPELLNRIKTNLAAQLPAMFGFAIFGSATQARFDGKIPFPCPEEGDPGGHAVVAIGYDDNMKIRNQVCGEETTGALLIRNSWGTEWGDTGYGWLPYDYVLAGGAVDWWSLVEQKWTDLDIFADAGEV